MLGTIGLRTALWNSRYWLIGIHLLFCAAIVACFLATACLFSLTETGITDFSEFRRIAVSYWFAPLIVTLVIEALAWVLAQQEAQDPTRSDPANEPEYNHIREKVETLCLAAGIDEPELYVVHHPSINAFIWGNEEIRLYITEGAIQQLDEDEMDALLAHELGRLAKGENYVFPTINLFYGMTARILTLSFFALTIPFGLYIGSIWVVVLQIEFAIIFSPSLVLYFFLKAYRKAYGETRQYMADIFSLSLNKDTGALVRAILKTKDQPTLFVIPGDWRGLAFVSPTRLKALWHADPDKRIEKLQKTLHTAII
jgi:Zn-dependent protease with chaperone function